MKIALVLKRVLKEKGLSLKALAHSINVKPSTLSGWLQGSSPRDLVEVHRCSEFLGISMEKLLFDTEPRAASLEDFLTENIFDGFLKVKIERVIQKKGNKT